MKQPRVYSREQIVEAGLDSIREMGWAATTTRAIAKRIGSSTMPIYSHFQSRDDLELELRRRSRELLAEHQRRTYTEHRLLNAAFGYVVFARDEKNLFRFLFIDNDPANFDAKESSAMETFTKEQGNEAMAGTVLENLDMESQEALVEHTWIFTHGLAMMVNAAGTDNTFDDEKVLKLLLNAGQAFYLLEASKEKTKREEGEVVPFS